MPHVPVSELNRKDRKFFPSALFMMLKFGSGVSKNAQRTANSNADATKRKIFAFPKVKKNP